MVAGNLFQCYGGYEKRMLVEFLVEVAIFDWIRAQVEMNLIFPALDTPLVPNIWSWNEEENQSDSLSPDFEYALRLLRMAPVQSLTRFQLEQRFHW